MGPAHCEALGTIPAALAVAFGVGAIVAASVVALQLLLLGCVFQLLALVCDSGWALAAGTARAWFANSPRRTSSLAGVGGLMMIGLGGTLALTASKA